MYGYNQAGRVTGQRMTIVPVNAPYVNLNAAYTWDNRGRMTAVQYPSRYPQPNGNDSGTRGRYTRHSTTRWGT